MSIEGLGFPIEGSGCRVWGVRVRVPPLKVMSPSAESTLLPVWGQGFEGVGLWFVVWGSGFGVEDIGCRVWGAGCRELGEGYGV